MRDRGTGIAALEDLTGMDGQGFVHALVIEDAGAVLRVGGQLATVLDDIRFGDVDRRAGIPLNLQGVGGADCSGIGLGEATTQPGTMPEGSSRTT